MQAFGPLLTVAVVVVGLGAEPEPGKTPPEKGLTVQGKTLDQWTALAKDKEPAVRMDAAAALGRLGPTAVPALAELLRDQNVHVRGCAASALVGIGPAARRPSRRSSICSATRRQPSGTTPIGLLPGLVPRPSRP